MKNEALKRMTAIAQDAVAALKVEERRRMHAEAELTRLRALKHSASIAMCPQGYALADFIADFHPCRRYFKA